MVPTPLFLLAFLPAAPALALGGLTTPIGRAGLAWCLLVLGLLILDNRLSLRWQALHVQRLLDRKLSLGAANRVSLQIVNESRWRLDLLLRDEPPDGFVTPLRDLRVTLEPHESTATTYLTTPPQRGRFRFGDLHVRGRSFLRLSVWQKRLPAACEVDVYPDIGAVARLDLLWRAHRLEEIGLRRATVRGAGTEFESLREYVRDDDYRRIDWKATARKGRPFTRQYEEERSRTVMLLLDAGRLMTTEVDGLSKLDHAVNAALMLAYVALRRDDAVGVIAFAETVKVVLPPRKGKAQLQRVLEALYNLQPTMAEPDYRAALYHLHDRARKRSLAVLFTDLTDDQASRRLIAHVAATVPRHLPLLVTLGDPDIVRVSRQRPASREDLFERAVASSVLADRDRALATLRTNGAVVLETEAAQLSVAVVNRYLELKERLRV
ncbi:MAG: DUF58 domain-containing protein [Armatimonadetes bacterium]|nr:DUF58 domain-containing protein [Armatimonadota bacterium]